MCVPYLHSPDPFQEDPPCQSYTSLHYNTLPPNLQSVRYTVRYTRADLVTITPDGITSKTLTQLLEFPTVHASVCGWSSHASKIVPQAKQFGKPYVVVYLVLVRQVHRLWLPLVTISIPRFGPVVTTRQGLACPVNRFMRSTERDPTIFDNFLLIVPEKGHFCFKA